jgi:homogentisate phytyltransferase/homogentisate geranylgeranyltransferase
MNALTVIWKFSRPHTIIGSIVSIVTLYSIICANRELECLSYLLMALSIGITCNLFIVGINQIADVEIDRINKPWLPIPSGKLSINRAKLIVASALSISLSLSLCVSLYLFAIVLLAAIIGWAYSMPPFYLKRHHVSAALAIATVRAVILNAGGFLVFNHLVNHTLMMPENVKILTLFIFMFSIVISWFKDLADIEGDAKFHIKTLAIRYSPKTALISGHVLVGLAYLFTIFMKGVEYFSTDTPSFNTKVLLFGHVILFEFFFFNAFSIKPNQPQSIHKFYQRFWWFFFAEYVLYLVAYVG